MPVGLGITREAKAAFRPLLARVTRLAGDPTAKGRMENHGRFKASKETGERELSGESGIIVFGGGGGGSGPGCLFWILISVILSVSLTVIANLLFMVF